MNHLRACCARDHQKIISDRIQVDDSGCWIWQLAKSGNGYGKLAHKTRQLLAHRASYMAFVGEIPAGLELDHLCRVRDCVNPAHLEPVTHTENVRRGAVCAESRKDPNRVRGQRGTLTADDARHGTVNGYNNFKCRCQPCRDAHAINHRPYQRAYRARQERKAA